MELSEVIERFETNSKAFSVLLGNVTEEQIYWKPEGKWSLLEIICHLYDEEREDFRQRLKLTLENPEQDWPKINPEGWVTERKYLEQDFRVSLTGFLNERYKSIEWLKSLQNPNWLHTHIHPTIGEMSASFILYNWIAHDYLHLRQITKTLYSYLEDNIKPVSLKYAGEW